MSRIKMAALALVAVALAVAFAAAQASAALPEIGRCEPAAGHHGNYKYKGCVIPATPGTGAFEFHPGPGVSPNFEAVIGTPRMQTVGGKKVGCATGGITGEWGPGGKTATITSISFEGCGTEHTKCGTTPNPSTISNSNPLEGELGLIVGGEKPLVGLDIRAKNPTTESVLSFDCGTPITAPPAEHWTIEGSVIGSIKPPDLMVSEYKLLYAAKNGVQQYAKFETGLNDVLSANITGESGLTTEQLGLTLKGPEKSFIDVIGEEPLEIKAK
jgi:hypothetical protein